MCKHERLYNASWCKNTCCVDCGKVIFIEDAWPNEDGSECWYLLADGREIKESDLYYRPEDLEMQRKNVIGMRGEEQWKRDLSIQNLKSIRKKVVIEMCVNAEDFDSEWIGEYIKGNKGYKEALNQSVLKGTKAFMKDGSKKYDKFKEVIFENGDVNGLHVLSIKRPSLGWCIAWDRVKLVFGY